MNEKTRQQTILSTLKKTYPDAHIALQYRTPWELLVSVILSAQCTDVMVNSVTKKLFKKYPTLSSYCNADLKAFETDIRQTGFYHNKAKHILDAARRVQTTFQGTVPKTMEQILTLPGVARKTANVVLGNAYGVVEGIAVDTHVLRLSQRLRLVPMDRIRGKRAIIVRSSRNKLCAHLIDFYKDADPVKIEKELMAVIPKNQWFSVTYRFIDHGRAICKSRIPRCSSCVLNQWCPTARAI